MLTKDEGDSETSRSLDAPVSCATAQSTAGTATVQDVTVARDSSGLRVEVTLSSPVQPSIETAVNPDRILLDFPGTISKAIWKKQSSTDGVRRVRTGQHSTAPPVTRVVLDLDQAHSYYDEGGRKQDHSDCRSATEREPGPAAAPASPVSLGLKGIFGRKSDAPQSATAGQYPSIPSSHRLLPQLPFRPPVQ